MISIFISYSHVDEELRRQLDTHLMSLKRQGIVDVWHDRRIGAGEDFPNAIDAALNKANIILLLVSPDFIASTYCYEVEMTAALERHTKGEATVIPVILRTCEWQGLRFGHLRASPTDGKPIKQFTDLDSAFLEVIRDVKVTALKLADSQKPSAAPTGPRTVARPVVTIDKPRSGNLSVKKSFTEYERDRFLVDTYEYITRYFENSLDELGRRNQDIRTNFRQIDTTAFEATAYDGAGNARSRCGVWLRSGRAFGGEISYSSSGVGDRNSYNESLSVEDDGTSLGVKPMGMLSHSEKVLLTQEGGAEILWEAFIAPLQR